MQSRFVVPFVVLLAVVGTTACSTAHGHFESTLQVGTAPHVTINCPTGSVLVRGGSPGTVVVDADYTVTAIGASNILERWDKHPPISSGGSTVTIGTAEASSSSPLRHLKFHYQIVVPSDAEVSTNIGVGDAKVSGLESRLKINAGAGKVDLSEFSGEGTINSGVGHITADHFSGKLKIHTGTGGLHVRANQMKEGVIDLETGAGNVEISDLRGGLKLHTGTGSVKVSGSPASDWSIEDGTGSIEVSMAEKAAFNLKAECGAGNVSIAHPLTTVAAQSGRHVEGKVNGGGPNVTLKVGAGNITIN